METHFDDFVYGKMCLVAEIFTSLVYKRDLLNGTGVKLCPSCAMSTGAFFPLPV